MAEVNPNLRATAQAADMMTNALASLRWLPKEELDPTHKDDLMRQLICGATCLDALAFNGYTHAGDKLCVFRSELFRLGVAQHLASFAGQSASYTRPNP